MRAILKRIFSDTFHAAQAESAAFQTSEPGKCFDKKTAIILIVVAFSVALNKYLSEPHYAYSFLSLFSNYEFTYHTDSRLIELGWWVAVLFTFYFVVPALLIKLYFREKLSDYGLSFRGAFKDYHIYIIMLMVMIPLVLFFSTTKSFQARYPFYTLGKCESLYPNFFIWEFLYFIQFCGLEFFFRGFMVHGTKHRFGYYSVFVMTIPYCMIHFGKPLPETLSAIAAGIVLGTLSLKSRSVWLGIAIHYSVAITMDLAALWQKGML